MQTDQRKDRMGSRLCVGWDLVDPSSRLNQWQVRFPKA
jgi:hypothetical protein